MENGDYWVTTYDGMGGAGEPYRVYFEYSKEKIKLWGYHLEFDDQGNQFEVRDDEPCVFELTSEDILK